MVNSRQTILVTGGSGFIGSNFIRYVLGAEAMIVTHSFVEILPAGSNSAASLNRTPSMSLSILPRKRMWTDRFWMPVHLCARTSSGPSACSILHANTECRAMFRYRLTRFTAASGLKAVFAKTLRSIRPTLTRRRRRLRI